MNYIELIELYIGRKLLSDEIGFVEPQNNDKLQIAFWNIEDKPCPTMEQLLEFYPTIENDEYNEDIKAQILELEAKQPRAIREFALGDDSAKDILLTIEQQISVLRAKIK